MHPSSAAPLPSPSPHVTLAHLTVDVVRALADGDAARARRVSGLAITDFLAGDRALWVWQVTVAAELDVDGQRRWLACAVLDARDGVVVGHAGFHGPPRDGMVEIGYSIDPSYRRRGYGRATVLELLREARACDEVDRVRASINRTNEASFATVAGLGFVAVGERTVDDGSEVVLEMILDRP